MNSVRILYKGHVHTVAMNQTLNQTIVLEAILLIASNDWMNPVGLILQKRLFEPK